MVQVGFFGPVPYSSPEPVRAGFPAAPRHYDARHGVASMESALNIFELADDLGLDFVSMAEHHYAPRQLTPDPNIFAAAVTQRVKNAKIAIMGALLPMLDPVRVAEQFAMLDTLCNGRLVPGVFRGTPNELVVYHSNPAESRGRYEEGVRLIQKCWSEPEPFGWEGVYYRYRTIGLWPQPVQRPMPLLVSGNSEQSARFAGKHRLDIGFSLGNLTLKAEHVADYKAAARSAGWTPTSANVLSRYIIYVAPTDAQAQADYERLAKPSGPMDPLQAKFIGKLMAAGRGAPATSAPGPASGPPPGGGGFPTLIGSPDTILRKIEAVVGATGVGRFDFAFTGDWRPDDLAIASMKLFAKEIMPAVRKLDPQAAFERLGASALGTV